MSQGHQLPTGARSLGHQLSLLARLLDSALRERIAPHGVAPAQFALLLELFERDGQSQVELCKSVQVDQSTMAHTLRRMERDGLITRAASSTDKRRTEVWLTDHARGLKPMLFAIGRATGEAATRDIAEADLATVHRVLAQMIDNLEQADPPTG